MVVAAITLQPGPHPIGGVGIERRGGLVEQQQFRRVDQRLGERDPRLLPGRKLAGRPIEQIGQIERRAELFDPVGEAGHAIEHAEHGQILPDGQPHRHFDIGALEIHPMQHAVALAWHLRPEHGHAARRRGDEAHDRGDGGGLAGAVAAQKPGDGARRDRERNTVDGRELLVDFDQAFDFYGG